MRGPLRGLTGKINYKRQWTIIILVTTTITTLGLLGHHHDTNTGTIQLVLLLLFGHHHDTCAQVPLLLGHHHDTSTPVLLLLLPLLLYFYTFICGQSLWLCLAPNLLVNASLPPLPPPALSCYKLNNLMTRIRLYNCKLYFPPDTDRAINWLALWLQILFYFCCHFLSFQIVFLGLRSNFTTSWTPILHWSPPQAQSYQGSIICLY